MKFWLWMVLSLLSTTLAQEAPQTRIPFGGPEIGWATGILFPPSTYIRRYCYDPGVLQVLSSYGSALVLEYIKERHVVTWGRGQERVEFHTAMGLALEACVRLGPEVALSAFQYDFPPQLIVYGTARSLDELKRWRATLVLKGAKGNVLTALEYLDRYPLFTNEGGRFQGAMSFIFWSKTETARGLDGFLEARWASDNAHVIEFRVVRGGKEEVYRIEASKYPDLW